MHKKVERAKKREIEMLYSLISHKLDILNSRKSFKYTLFVDAFLVERCD